MSSQGNNLPWLPSAGNDQQDPSSSNADVLLVAILSLSAVIIFIVALHLYVRCIIRHHTTTNTTLRRTRSLSAITVREFKKGLEASALATIPKFAYSSSDRPGDPAECAVCLSLVDDGEVVRELPNCKHVFHVECIDMWLHSHSTCPVCRAGAEARPEEKAVAVVVSEEGSNCDEEAATSRPSRLGSLRRMLSGERPVRGQVQGEDLERQ